MKTLVKNGTVVTSTNEFVADILIENEKIAIIGQNIEVPDAKVIDATGKYVLPGGVDNHSHFEALNTDGVTTNGKVFEDDGYHVDIWEVVKDELLKYKDFFLGNKTFSHSSSYDSLNTDSFYDEDEVDDDESFINDILYNNKDDDF